MKLYLVQHGDAVPKQVNPDRPLSDRGRVDIERIGRFLGEAGVRIGSMRHSGKERAEQTARLIGAALGGGAGPGVERLSGIDPLDPPGEVVHTLNDWTVDTMVVGHQPFTGKLVSLMVTGDEVVSTVGYEPGTVICLERTEDSGWLIAWMIRPGLLAGT